MFNSIYIVRKLNATHSSLVSQLVELLVQAANDRRMFVFETEDRCNPNTLVVALGGDGTMLYAMRVAAKSGATAMGINLGRVGFLTDFSVEGLNQIDQTIRDVLEYQTQLYPIERRMLIDCVLKDSVALAGNEITVSRERSDSMITYRLRFNNVDAGVHRANSIIVSTPTGSTAYSLSAGGALMLPNMQALQVVPVAPMTITSRPIVVDSSTKITIECWGGKLAVRADGMEQDIGSETYSENSPYVIGIEPYPNLVNILHTPDWNFFDMLSNKLGWIKE